MEKLNLAKLLKDCPTGMELDSTLFEGLEFDCIVDNEYLPIRCRIKHPNGGYTVYNFTKYGCWLDTTFAKCVIFPKGQTTWEGFVPPCKFKDGDIIACTNCSCTFVAIYKHMRGEDAFYRYACLILNEGMHFSPNCTWSDFKNPRFATEEEKQKLFDAIKANDYKWNPDTMTLEKLIVPKFKVGDIIKSICSQIKYKVTDIRGDIYIIHNFSDKFGYHISFKEQDNYELVTNKFDITTLKPFESKVLVRAYDNQIWIPTFWGKYLEDDSNCRYLTTNGCYKYCISYEGNQHLLGTTDDCDKYYKTWE